MDALCRLKNDFPWLKQLTPDQILARDAAAKMRLESRLERESKALLNQVAKAATGLYAASGQLLNANEFTDEWEVLLRQHYRRATSKFDDTLRSEINADSDDFSEQSLNIVNSDELDSAIQLAALGFIGTRVPRSARSITNTTQDDLTRSLTNAITDVLQEAPAGAQISNRQIARQLGRRFRQTSAGRPITIGMTETGFSTEGARNIEAQQLGTQASGFIEISKMWITVGDNRVRPQQGGRFNHVAADRQLVPEDEAFIVTGERLMFPTDTSLGASLGNTINCRCIATRFARDITPPTPNN